jgi:branched-chain amino acid transport system permease protein
MVRQGISLYIAAPCGILVAGLLGLLTERIIITPLRRWRIAAWLIAGLGAEILLREVMKHLWGAVIHAFPSPFGSYGKQIVNIFGATTTLDQISLIFFSFLVVYIIETISDHTTWGIQMRATAYDETSAALMGINTNRVVMAVFTLSAAISGVSIILQAPYTGISSVMGFEIAVKGFVVALIGGLDSRRGSIASAIFVGILEAVGALAAPAGYRDVFTFGVLIFVLIARPQGFFSKPQLRQI